MVPTAREAVKGGGGEAAEEVELRADLRVTDGWVESTAAAQMAPATAGKTAAVMAAPMALAVAVTRVVAARAMAVAARAAACVLNMAPRTCYYERRVA